MRNIAEIEYIMEIMKEKKASYWDARKYYDSHYIDECGTHLYDIREVFECSVSDINRALYLKIIKNIFAHNDCEWTIVKSEWDVEYTCPECGKETGHDYCDSTNYKKTKEVFNRLINLDDECHLGIGKFYNIEEKKTEYIVEITEPTEYEEDGCICEECEESHNFFYDENGNYKEGGVDKLFDCKVWSHGLATGFSGNMSASSLLDRFASIDSNWQICCSDKSQRIGGIGLYVQGHVQYASNIDLYSRINNRGHRVFDVTNWRAEDGLITSPVDYSLDKWDHTESIITNFKIVGIWIKDWFLSQPGIKELWWKLCKIAKENNMAIHIVKARREE